MRSERSYRAGLVGGVSVVLSVVACAGIAAAQTGAKTAPASAPATAPATTSAPAVRAVHVFVSGRVQGVGFRDWTVREAYALKLTGWVRNLDDGRVEAVIEGPSEAVAKMLEKLQTGPSSAKVEKLDSTDEKPTGEFKDFQRR